MEKLPAAIKKLVADRIREVEANLSTQVVVPRGTPQLVAPYPLAVPPSCVPGVPPQAPSMQRIIDDNPGIIPPPPVTAAAAEALQRRQQAIKSGTSEKPEPGRSGPRKF